MVSARLRSPSQRAMYRARRTFQGDDIIGQKFHSSLACVARGSHTVASPVIAENRPSDSDGVSAPRHHDMSGKHDVAWYGDGACGDSADAASCYNAKKNCVAALREYHPGRYPWHFHLAPHRGLSVRRPPSARLELATILSIAAKATTPIRVDKKVRLFTMPPAPLIYSSYTTRAKPISSPITVVGPIGSGSGLAILSFMNSILSFQTFRRKSSKA